MPNGQHLRCSAKNARGDECWAPPSEQNPMHAQLPLCWAHTAKFYLEANGNSRPLPQRVLRKLPLLRVV